MAALLLNSRFEGKESCEVRGPERFSLSVPVRLGSWPRGVEGVRRGSVEKSRTLLKLLRTRPRTRTHSITGIQSAQRQDLCLIYVEAAVHGTSWYPLQASPLAGSCGRLRYDVIAVELVDVRSSAIHVTRNSTFSGGHLGDCHCPEAIVRFTVIIVRSGKSKAFGRVQVTGGDAKLAYAWRPTCTSPSLPTDHEVGWLSPHAFPPFLEVLQCRRELHKPMCTR